MSVGVKMSNLSIGIPMLVGSSWLGGVHYTHNLVNALDHLPEDARPTVTLLVREDTPEEYYRHLINDKTKVSVIRQKVIGRIVGTLITRLKGVLEHRAFCESTKLVKVDALFPIRSAPARPLSAKWAGWIPDFQHIHLPEMFSEQEIGARTNGFRRLSKSAKNMVFSSKNALEDFEKYFADNDNIKRVLSFASVLPAGVFEVDRKAVRDKYRLPDKYLFLTNQFWKHKNHIVVFKAINILKAKGIDVKLYCSGDLSDYRHPEHCIALKKYITDNGLEQNIIVMGVLPREDQIQVMRSAAALVQPSLFEGWSTVVEEGKTLGKVMFISDLPVHFEQNAEHAIYFERNSPEDLADKIFNVWHEIGIKPASETEEKARRQNPERFRRFAAEFTEIMRDLS